MRAALHGKGNMRKTVTILAVLIACLLAGAALAFAREVERRAPELVTTTWWRKDRDPAAVFVDYNQNARDHTIAAAYSVRGNARGTVSTPITWDEIADVEPQELTMATVPARFAEHGDLRGTAIPADWPTLTNLGITLEEAGEGLA